MGNLRAHRAFVPVIAKRRVSLPYSVDFSQSASLPNGWVGSAAAISGGKLVITPNKGADLITNGNFAAWTADNPDSWTVTETVTQNPAGQAQITTAGPLAGLRQQVLAQGKWYEIALDCTARVSGALIVTDFASVRFISTVDSVATYVGTGVDTHVTTHSVFIKRVGACDVTIDNVVTKRLTDADLFTYYNQAISNVGSIKAGWVIGANRRSGVIGWWDKAAPLANCIVAVHDGIANCQLIKYVGTTPAVLIDNTTTNYVSGRSVEIRKTAATTFQLWYNDAQIGTDQTVSDAAIINNQYFGVFGTSPDSQCASFYLNP